MLRLRKGIVNYTFFQYRRSVEMSVCGVRCILLIGAGEGAEGLSRTLWGQWATVVGGDGKLDRQQ